MVKGLFDEYTNAPEVVRGLPPDHAHGLTFHLPLELQALEFAGAPAELIADRVDQRLPEAFADSLIDPPLYRWAEAHYEGVGARLAGDDVDERRRGFSEIVALGPGLAGAAFHPIIRMAYGALRSDAHEMARGLAYLRTRRQVLFAGRPRRVEVAEVELPTPADFAGISVFEQIDFISGDPAFFASSPASGSAASASGSAGADGESELPSVAELCAQAMGLVHRNPSSFIAIHAVTGLHALVEIANLLSPRSELGGVPDDPLLDAWWQAMTHAVNASAVLLTSTGAERGYEHRDFANLESLVATATTSPEVHDLKLSISLSRLAALGVTTEREAIALGAQKLAATECSAA